MDYSLSTGLEDPVERGMIMQKIGNIFEKMGQPTEAMKYFHDAALSYAEAGLPYDNVCMATLMQSMKLKER